MISAWLKNFAISMGLVVWVAVLGYLLNKNVLQDHPGYPWKIALGIYIAASLATFVTVATRRTP